MAYTQCLLPPELRKGNIGHSVISNAGLTLGFSVTDENESRQSIEHGMERGARVINRQRRLTNADRKHSRRIR
jgi:hypothetical protein